MTPPPKSHSRIEDLAIIPKVSFSPPGGILTGRPLSAPSLKKNAFVRLKDFLSRKEANDKCEEDCIKAPAEAVGNNLGRGRHAIDIRLTSLEVVQGQKDEFN
jgi:hypothetical protein